MHQFSCLTGLKFHVEFKFLMLEHAYFMRMGRTLRNLIGGRFLRDYFHSSGQ